MGAIEIYELPKKGADGIPLKNRYIFGVDTIDDDTGTSLGSIFGLDLFTDTIVCEYTGRPTFANDFMKFVQDCVNFIMGLYYTKQIKKVCLLIFYKKVILRC